MLHVGFNMLMVMSHSTFSHMVSIVVCQVLSNMVVMVNMTAFSVVATVLFHMLGNMLMVVLNVPAVFHSMNVAMLFGVGVLNVVQLGLAVMLFSTAMKWMLMVCDMVVMFHDNSLINRLFRRVSYPRAYLRPS
jgi:hypothetical protein